MGQVIGAELSPVVLQRGDQRHVLGIQLQIARQQVAGQVLESPHSPAAVPGPGASCATVALCLAAILASTGPLSTLP